MSATKEAGGSLQRSKNLSRNATTEEIRAFLSDLKMRPRSQRQVLCRMIRRAAAYASPKDSEVNPAVTHHTTAP